MVAVPHRKYNRRHFNTSTHIHVANSCCETLLENATKGRFNGKTLLFVPYVALKTEGVTKEMYEKWLNCLMITGIKWKHSTLDKWESLSSWATASDDNILTVRSGVRRKQERIQFRYWEYQTIIKDIHNPLTDRTERRVSPSPDSQNKRTHLSWNEPGYIIELSYTAGKLKGEHNRISYILQMVRFPFFKGSEWQDKGWFMTLWHEKLYTNNNLDDWAKISLSYLLMPDIDLDMENGYFVPFGRNKKNLFPNTFGKFMTTGDNYYTRHARTNVTVDHPWAVFKDNSLRSGVGFDALKKAILGKSHDNMHYFIDAIKRAMYLDRMGADDYMKHSRVTEEDLTILIDFIKTHTKLIIEDDKQLEIRDRPRNVPDENIRGSSVFRRTSSWLEEASTGYR